MLPSLKNMQLTGFLSCGDAAKDAPHLCFQEQNSPEPFTCNPSFCFTLFHFDKTDRYVYHYLVHATYLDKVLLLNCLQIVWLSLRDQQTDLHHSYSLPVDLLPTCDIVTMKFTVCWQGRRWWLCGDICTYEQRKRPRQPQCWWCCEMRLARIKIYKWLRRPPTTFQLKQGSLITKICVCMCICFCPCVSCRLMPRLSSGRLHQVLVFTEISECLPVPMWRCVCLCAWITSIGLLVCVCV